MAIICPSCGNEADTTNTRYGPRNACCGLWSWGKKPLMDRATHEARQAAHDAFDQLWRSGLVNRGKAYLLLQRELGLSEPECHMAVMRCETALLVPLAAARIREKLESEKHDNIQTVPVLRWAGRNPKGTRPCKSHQRRCTLRGM